MSRNVQVRPGNRWLEFKKKQYSDREIGYYLLTKISKGKIVELLTTTLLLWVLIKEKAHKYDLLHFHIAYPLLIHYHLWKRWIKTRVLISEHWSAYHFNFYLPQSSSKLEGIKRIFRQGIPVIAVSHALLQDIRKFSGSEDFPGHVLPNVIDLATFRYVEGKVQPNVPVFFMVNVWREIKNPFPMLAAFHALVAGGIEMKLILGGYGSLLENMQHFVDEKGIGAFIDFPGKMNKQEIADVLQQSDAYLFSSEYETFSIACAQALCCGVPLIGPSIPAILEYAGERDMVTVYGNNPESWEAAFRQFFEKRALFHREEIAERAAARFSAEAITESYGQIVEGLSRTDA